ncbi:MAG: DUF1730 domain-containing protein [Oscillospiraceae bacterium]
MDKIKKIMEENNITCFGAIPFHSLAPIIECRARLRIPENARSVIVMLFPYNVGDFPERNISKYAMLLDYHIVADEILGNVIGGLKAIFPNEEFQAFADNSPINEVDAGAKAGLGVIGENGLLINSIFGSYVFIGEIVTTAVVPYTLSEIKHCPSCGHCKRACPQGAISHDGFKKDICLSAITQKKGQLTEKQEFAIKKGGLVWGCDVCNDVCPLNKGVEKSDIPRFYENIIPKVTKENAEEIIKNRAFNYRGIKTITRNIDIIQKT